MEIRQIRMPLLAIFKVRLSDKLPFTELKFAVRNVARDNPLYFEPVKIDIKTDVDVSNFGRWLFGVKGFAGHWKNTPADENRMVTILLPDLEEARELVEKALEILKVQGVIEDIYFI